MAAANSMEQITVYGHMDLAFTCIGTVLAQNQLFAASTGLASSLKPPAILQSTGPLSHVS